MSLKRLTQAFGVSGYEKEVRDIIKEEIKDYVDEISIDALGNLIALKKGIGTNKKKIMLAAHMDEIGLQVTKIEENGMIKVKSLGFLWIPTTYMSRIKFRNGTVGIVASTIKAEDIKNDFTKLYVDIGLKSKAEVLKYVNIGDVASYIGEYAELKDDIITAKALDNRIGCYMQIEAIKKIDKPYNDTYFVFTVQEELGCRGSKVAAERIKPDLGVAVDITPAHDYPCDLEGSNAVGGGIAIKVSDTSVICNEYLVSEMVKCAEENNIKYQLDVLYVGGTDASSMNTANYGTRVAGISVVTRYPHGPNSMASMKDVEASIELLTKFVDRVFCFDNE
jgi:endoglucanase